VLLSVANDISSCTIHGYAYKNVAGAPAYIGGIPTKATSPEEDSISLYAFGNKIVVNTLVNGETIEIYNLQGQLLDQQNFSINNTRIGINPGIDVVIAVVTSGEERISKKLVLGN